MRIIEEAIEENKGTDNMHCVIDEKGNECNMSSSELEKALKIFRWIIGGEL